MPPRISPSPRLVLFDLDDTLCDYARARALRLRLAFSLDLGERAVAPGAAERDLDRMIADSLATEDHGADHFPELFRRHGVDDPAIAEAAAGWYRANRCHGLELFGDALETIAALRDLPPSDGGRVIGLVTNGPAEVQREKIALLGLDRVVDFAVVSGEFGIWKPDPRIFWEALRLGGAAPEEALFVGDSAEFDIAGARAVGMRTVWVNRSDRSWTTGSPPDWEICDLAELVRMMRSG